MLDVSFLDLQLAVAGVNHLPFITEIDVGGRDGFELLRDLLAHADDARRRAAGDEPARGPRPRADESAAAQWTKRRPPRRQPE